MHPIDRAILQGEDPPEPTTPPAAPGTSYYWDCRAEGLPHADAVARAGLMMERARASVARVENDRLTRDPLRRHGGARPNSGRTKKRGPKRISRTVSMLPASWDALDAYVQEHGLRGRGEAVERLMGPPPE